MTDAMEALNEWQISAFCNDYGKSWKSLRRMGYRAVKIVIHEVVQ